MNLIPIFYISLYISIYLYMSLYIFIYFYIYLFLSISLYISLYLTISLYISLYLSISLYISLYLYISLSLCIYISICISVLWKKDKEKIVKYVMWESMFGQYNASLTTHNNFIPPIPLSHRTQGYYIHHPTQGY